MNAIGGVRRDSDLAVLETASAQAIQSDDLLEHISDSREVDAFFRWWLEKEIHIKLRDLRAGADYMTYIDIQVVVPLCDPCCFIDEQKTFPIVFGPDWLDGYKNLGLLIGLSRRQIAEVARALRNGDWLPSCWQCGDSIDLNSEEGFHISRVNFSEYFNLDMSPGRRSSNRLRKLVSEVFGTKCVVCQCEATTLDHILAYARVGVTEAANLQPMCRGCNAAKADRDVEMITANLTFPLRPPPSEGYEGFIW